MTIKTILSLIPILVIQQKHHRKLRIPRHFVEIKLFVIIVLNRHNLNDSFLNEIFREFKKKNFRDLYSEKSSPSLSAVLKSADRDSRPLPALYGASCARRTPHGTPFRFFIGAPKIYEMCLHVPLRERGCRGGIARTEEAGGTHAFSLREKCDFIPK